MFSGIIEAVGYVKAIDQDGSNINFKISNPFGNELYIDQSIAHDGCCLTIVAISENYLDYTVTAIKETLDLSILSDWHIGSKINLERCIRASSRIDGHFVQGHVDASTECQQIEDMGGSWSYTFALPESCRHLVVNKGSIAINGVSLTLILDKDRIDIFKVAIIPYTYTHTNFHALKIRDLVNLEFDLFGKYLARYKELEALKT